MRNGIGSTALAKIQLSGANNDILFYVSPTNFESRVNDKTLSYLRVTILDESGNVFNQFPLGWSCTLDLRFYKALMVAQTK